MRHGVHFRPPQRLEAVPDPKRDVVKPDVILLQDTMQQIRVEEPDVVVILAQLLQKNAIGRSNVARAGSWSQRTSRQNRTEGSNCLTLSTTCPTFVALIIGLLQSRTDLGLGSNDGQRFFAVCPMNPLNCSATLVRLHVGRRTALYLQNET